MRILVVGGAGYIGSHCIQALLKNDFQVIALDNLVFGHREAIPSEIPFYKEDLGNYTKVREILKKEKIDAVMHFAGYINVGESSTDPLTYYRNNVGATYELLQAMVDEGVNKFVFSSSCAVYGIPQKLPLTENAPKQPINPYGQTKLDIENALSWLAKANKISFASLRYFNAAGAAADASIGEDHEPETHLIPLILQSLLGQRKEITVFGTDYNTPDGTCLRDYVHVEDLANAHILALRQLKQNGLELFYNLGTGKPYSVMEIIKACEKVTGLKVPFTVGARREGDPPMLYADPTKAMQELGWKPKYIDIESIIETAWRWHRKRAVVNI